MDGERDAAFDRAIYNNDGDAVPLCKVSFDKGWQARASLPSAQPSDVVEAARALITEATTATDGNYRAPMMLVYERDLDALANAVDALTTQQAQNTAPLNGGIRQLDEAPASGIINSTSRVSLPNNCDGGVQAQSGDVARLVEAARDASEYFRSQNDMQWGYIEAIDYALTPFTQNKGD